MEIEVVVPLRAAMIGLSLLLIVQSPRIVALSYGTQSKACSDDHLSYLVASGQELYCVNGSIVDKIIFCEALQLYDKNHYMFERFCGIDSRGWDNSLVDVHIKAARKLLQHEVREEMIVPRKEEKIEPKSLVTVRNVGIVASGAFASCCAFICPCWYRKKRSPASGLAKDPHSISSLDGSSASKKIPASPLRVPPSPSRFSLSPKLSRLGSVHLTMSQAVTATRNFSPALKIGKGEFGTVYKAQLEDGQLVAIKRAKKEYFENLRTKFSSEVELLEKIDHWSLVKLLGYVDKGNECLIITEYVGNGTLREHLDGQHGKILDFNQRLGIAIDIAHGLTYLHLYAEKQIIHRDVKSSNILLTESMRAKVADFGYARLGPMDTENTHISTHVKGTVGYLDPEYMRTFQLTTKSDVYSFGVLLVEILTGRRPLEVKRSVEERMTIRWAFQKYNKGNVVELLDPLMEEAVPAEILVKMFELSFECAAPVRADRPEMKLVGEQLWSIRADYCRSAARRG